MKRTGLSLSLNYVVVGVIILAAAALILLNFSGNVGDFQSIVGGQMSDSERQLAENACLREKPTICQKKKYAGSNEWAKEAQYKGAKCWDLAKSQKIFGPGGQSAIPKCPK